MADNLFIIFLISVTVYPTELLANEEFKNVTCVFHEKKRLACDFNPQHADQYTCHVCPYFRGGKHVNNTCPSNFDVSKCPKSRGRCLYDCVELGYCREAHMIHVALTKSQPAWCQYVDTSKLVKPGPVRDLKVMPINSSSLKVKWKKPADRDSEDDFYRYEVYCQQNASRTTMRRKTDKERMEGICRDLHPYTLYTVSVVARPRRQGFSSEPTSVSLMTPEDVPTSGPVIPAGAFVLDKERVVIYWGLVPKKKQRGKIAAYSLRVVSHVNTSMTSDPCVNLTLTSDTYWSKINRSQCDFKVIDVRTFASTSVGWTKTPFVRTVNLSVHDSYRVEMLNQTARELTWHYPSDKHVTSFSVYWCYGSKDEDSLHVVSCKVPLQWLTLSGQRRSLVLEDLATPSVSCSLCSWRYAVSVNVCGHHSGMTWSNSTAELHLSTIEAEISLAQVSALKPNDLTAHQLSVETMLGVILALLSLVIGVIVAVLCILYKKNIICESIVIVLPDDTDIAPLQFSSMSLKAKLFKTKQVSEQKNHAGFGQLMFTQSSDNGSNLTGYEASSLDGGVPEVAEETPTNKPDEKDDWAMTEGSLMSDYRQVAQIHGPQTDAHEVGPSSGKGSSYLVMSSTSEGRSQFHQMSENCYRPSNRVGIVGPPDYTNQHIIPRPRSDDKLQLFQHLEGLLDSHHVEYVDPEKTESSSNLNTGKLRDFPESKSTDIIDSENLENYSSVTL